jgi:hypothetical protein
MHHFTPSFQQKRLVLLHIFAENAQVCFFSIYTVHSLKGTVSLCVFANNALFNSALSSKTRSFTRLFYRRHSKGSENSSCKDSAKFRSHFWQQRSGMLHSFGENGKLYKFWIPGRIPKRLSKMLAILCLISINEQMMQERLKQEMKISCMCPFHNESFWICRFYHVRMLAANNN